MGRLDGKVVLISGGARGQGAVEVRLFAREGARVVFGDLLDTEGRQLEAEIRGAGGEVTYLHLDVTREDDWRAAVGAAVNRYGRLDVLVNNAGILLRKRTEDTSAEEWDRVLAVNVTGVFFGTKHALPALRQAGGGSIVNISSIAGLVGSVYGSSAYTATKGAVRLFTKSIAIQHAGENIRCNSIHPGPIDTEMMRDVFGDPAMREERRNRIPLRRIGRAEDVAYGALYLASDEASFVTGAELVIDGGITAQ
jgi:NAD(P)-dependent dehydrogenase (short-subunit alcohol dehydrogenase family)